MPIQIILFLPFPLDLTGLKLAVYIVYILLKVSLSVSIGRVLLVVCLASFRCLFVVDVWLVWVYPGMYMWVAVAPANDPWPR